jgi:hypothetical protein
MKTKDADNSDVSGRMFSARYSSDFNIFKGIHLVMFQE